MPLSRASSEPLVSTPAAEFAANISPDGRYFAYDSFEGGAPEIVIRPYPDAARQQWQISTAGGAAPVWSRNGRELFYLDTQSGALMSVAVDTSGPELKIGKATELFTTKHTGWTFYNYDVAADAGRFLFIKQPTRTTPIVVFVNWTDELRAGTATT